MFLCLAAMAAGIHAQEASAPGRPVPLRRACRDDWRKLCPGAHAGGGHFMACLAAHKEQLSQRCREALDSARKGQPQPQRP